MRAVLVILGAPTRRARVTLAGRLMPAYRGNPRRRDPCASTGLHFCCSSSAPMRIVTTGETGSDDALNPCIHAGSCAVFQVPDPFRFK